MATNKINVVQGKRKEFTLDIEKGSDPFDLTGVNEVKVCFPGDGGTPVELSSNTAGELTITNATLGKVSGVLPAAKSANLIVGEDQNVQVEVSQTAGEPEAQVLEESLNVTAAVC